MSSQEKQVEKINLSEIRGMVSEAVETITASQPQISEGKKPNGYWTKERCYNEAKKYHSNKEFREANVSAYAISVRNGWICEYSWLSSSVKPKGYWNRETCYDEAKKYHSRAEFNRECSTGYEVARKNGWLDDYTWFQERIVSEKNIYIVYCYKDEETNSIYVGLTNNLKRRHNQHKNGWYRHGLRHFDVVYRFFDSINMDVPNPIVLEEDLYANEAQLYEELYVEQFRNKGLNVLNLAKTGSLGGYGKWDREACYNEAKKYKSKLEFRNGSYGAYQVASNNGWLDEYTWLDKVFGKWTRETCYNEAKKYKSRTAFQNGSKGAYLKAFRSGWLDDYTWLTRPEVHNKKWDRDTCYEEAKKYTTRAMFRKGNGSAYEVARKYGWFNDYTWLAAPKTIKKWTRETCYEEAKKYKSRTEFSDNCSKAYNLARKNEWLDDYTWFSKPKTILKWTREKCYDEAKKYNTKTSFKKNSNSAYSAALKKGWLDDYTWLADVKKPNGYWTKERCHDEAKRFNSRAEFSKECGVAYNVAKKNGWLDDYTWFNKLWGKWNYEACYDEAKKYNTRESFRKKAGGAYYAAWKNKWLNDYTWFEKIK